MESYSYRHAEWVIYFIFFHKYVSESGKSYRSFENSFILIPIIVINLFVRMRKDFHVSKYIVYLQDYTKITRIVSV